MLHFLIALALSLAPLSGALAQTGVASGMTVTATGGTTARTMAAWLADSCNVIGEGADPSGVSDSSTAFSLCNATGKNVYAPTGTYRLVSPAPIGSTSTTAGSQILFGDGWGTVLDISTDFDPSANGVVEAAIGNSQFPQFGVSNLRINFHQPADLTTTTTASTATSGTTITVASVTGLAIGYYVVDTTAAAIPTATNAGALSTTITNITGNIITLSSAVIAPGVGSGDSISFAQPRANFKTLSSGCSLTAGSPGCKYPWAVYNNGTSFAYVDHILISGAWDGIYQRGGTFYFNYIYAGALDQGLNIDNSHNFPQLDNYELWNFGFNDANHPAFLQNYYDGSPVCANIGATDGLSGGSVQCWSSALNITSNWTWGDIDNVQMDGDNANFSAANTGSTWIKINNLYSTKSVNTTVPLAMSGTGSVIINSVEMSSGASSNSLAAGNIQVTAGYLHILGGNIFAGETGTISDSVVSGGTLEIDNTTLDSGSGCGNVGSVGYIAQSSTGVLKLLHDSFTTSCASAGRIGVSLGVDNASNYVDIMLNGWAFSGSGITGKLGSYQTNSGQSYEGTASVNVKTINGVVNIIAPSSINTQAGLTVTGTSANGGGINIVGNGATNPSKWVRVSGGTFQILNNAYSSPIFQLNDNGNSQFFGSITDSALSTSGTIAGSICATSGGLILYESGATSCTISLESVKKNIAHLDAVKALNDVMSLQPIAFEFKDPAVTGRRYGFGANQVHSVDPLLSTFDGNGNLQAFDPNGILANLVVVVQQQQHEIDDLKRRLH